MRIALDAIEEARAQTRGGRSVPYATAYVYLRGTAHKERSKDDPEVEVSADLVRRK